MGCTPEEYFEQLKKLLPQGYAWPHRRDALFYELLRAFAEELSHVGCRLLDLIEESNPCHTVELLLDWERVLGFPDACIGEPATLAERQSLLCWRYKDKGAQSPADLIYLALIAGFTITIEEHNPFRVNEHGMGDPLNGIAWQHAFTVHAAETTLRYFHMNSSAMGERLLDFGNDALECMINANKPAHTIAIFVYDL